jgi:hypothetical protein
VATTLAEIDSMWDKLNEHDINLKMREKCLPPAVIKYGELGEDEEEATVNGTLVGIFFAIFGGGCIVGVALCCCRQIHARKQTAGNEARTPGDIPGVLPGAMPTEDVPVMPVQAWQTSAVPVAQVASPGAVEMTHLSDLPPGWSKAVDSASGREYYQNDWTHTTQWERPSGHEIST